MHFSVWESRLPTVVRWIRCAPKRIKLVLAPGVEFINTYGHTNYSRKKPLYCIRLSGRTIKDQEGRDKTMTDLSVSFITPYGYLEGEGGFRDND
jgi:hypothetical protein